MTDKFNDADILSAQATHPDLDTDMHFERTTYGRRCYYRLFCGKANRVAGLTDAKHARLTIEYWTARGWVKQS